MIIVLGLTACGGGGGGGSSTSSSSSSSSGGSSTQTSSGGSPRTAASANVGPTEEAPGVYTGTTSCNHPHTVEFDGTATEVITIEGTFNVPASAAGSATANVALRFGTDPVLDGETPVAISGAATGSAPFTGSRTLNVRQSGLHSLQITVTECVPTSYRIVVTHDVPAATNATRETATAVTTDAGGSGSFGCGEERWFSYEARRRGRVNVTLAGVARIAEGTGDAKLTLENDAGPVLASGNPIAVSATLTSPVGEPVTQAITIPRPGRYFLHLTFGDHCTVADYQVSVAN